MLSVPLQEKGTYRSWWVDWETALWSGSVCWRGWGSGGGETEAFLFLPRPRPTFRVIESFMITISGRKHWRLVSPRHPVYLLFLSPAPVTPPPSDSGSHKGSSVVSLGEEFKCLFLCFWATHQSEWRLDRPLATLSASIETVMHSSVTASFGPPAVMF